MSNQCSVLSQCVSEGAERAGAGREELSAHLVPVVTLVQPHFRLGVAQGDYEGEQVTPEAVDEAESERNDDHQHYHSHPGGLGVNLGKVLIQQLHSFKLQTGGNVSFVNLNTEKKGILFESKKVFSHLKALSEPLIRPVLAVLHPVTQVGDEALPPVAVEGVALEDTLCLVLAHPVPSRTEQSVVGGGQTGQRAGHQSRQEDVMMSDDLHVSTHSIAVVVLGIPSGFYRLLLEEAE